MSWYLRQHSRSVVTSQEIFVGKGTPFVVNACGTGPIPVYKIASLRHESFDNSVEGRIQITTLLMSRRGCLAILEVVDKILHRFRDIVLVKDQIEIQNLLADANLHKRFVHHIGYYYFWYYSQCLLKLNRILSNVSLVANFESFYFLSVEF
jgi:hypothetical protein